MASASAAVPNAVPIIPKVTAVRAEGYARRSGLQVSEFGVWLASDDPFSHVHSVLPVAPTTGTDSYPQQASYLQAYDRASTPR
ncbi:hypothetical protein GCM10008179_00110 [Hansschlegelia plantiphila]|uniref:Uncharacterized protein n=1 Tax=Hansschlegelia plantiphila TaxID=374655 RepID=A0A9W6MU06_9HYPH|nr:hypothetical protein GCM10008179_00110 [Hansschlegelia plantiphila]